MTLYDGPDPVDVAVGARVRIRRRWMGISQTRLADALGITFQQVQKYERGANRISASMLVKAAQKLETTVAALVGEDDQEPVEPIIYTQLATPGAPELLTAYAKIEDAETRRSLQVIVDTMATQARGAHRNRTVKKRASSYDAANGDG